MSNKPANGPFLAHQRWKEQEAERKARQARGEKPLRTTTTSGTVWSALKWLTIVVVATMALGNFLVKSPFWGYGDQIVKTYKSLTTVCPLFGSRELC